MARIWNKHKQINTPLKRKVFVGLSGGVDSAVSAALLKKDGYDVTGVFIKAWTPDGYPCGWREDRRSAMRVCAILDIPFLTLDLEKEYKKEVVDYMIDEYKLGRTPNPDIMCNKEIKFGRFLKFALDNGADFVATGHYVRNKSSSMNYKLWEGKDKNKDQSYFLWTLTQDQLKHILFPIGHLQKPEVRKLAGKFGLPQETRKDSQGICFLGKIDIKEFLKEYIGTKKGKVLNEKGEEVGEHDGSLLYTIGERHGFLVNNKNIKSDPLYVISKDLNKNTITVASKTPLNKKCQRAPLTLDIEKINWINQKPDLSKKYSCRIRYRGEKMPCRIKNNEVIFDTAPFDLSAGQSLVLYDNEICLGGGIIK